MIIHHQKPDKGILKRLLESFSGLSQCEELDLKRAYRLENKKIRLPLKNYPIQLIVGSDENLLHIYPERQLNDIGRDSPIDRYIIFNPKKYYKEVSGFLRLCDGESLIIGRHQEAQKKLLRLEKEIAGRHLIIANDDGILTFKNLDAGRGTCISPLVKAKDLNRINKWRYAKLKRLRTLFGGRIDLMDAGKALDLIRRVNRIMEDEAYRESDSNGRPGGMVKLPRDTTPFIIGDLHTKADNLLVVLSQNGFLKALKKGRATLVVLGDAVHSEEEGELEKMQSSMLMMDLIFQLKLHFPKQFFYIRGNHDGFSEDLGKRGVPQGLIWDRALIKFRSREYRNEMQRFYDRLPYIVYSNRFIACHAAPPVSSVTYHDLVNISDKPGLIEELTKNRLRKPNRPRGYFKREIKKFRKCLGVASDTPVIVGHTPITQDDTLWENVGDIDNHYVVYGADNRWIGTITQIDGQMHPLRYPVEPIIPLINAIEE